MNDEVMKQFEELGIVDDFVLRGFDIYQTDLLTSTITEKHLIESSCARSLKSLLSTDEYIDLCKEKCFEGNPKYDLFSWHGSTVLWIRTPTELLVGVDSFAAAIHVDNNPITKLADYEGYMSEVEQKFVPIMKGIDATLCGGADRCNGMVLYVRQKMLTFMVEGEEVTITRVGEAATKYFHEVSPLPPLKKDLPSIVFIFFWKPLEQKYHIIEVGDAYKVAVVREEDVFGSGSGSSIGVYNLMKPTTPKDVSSVKNELIEAAINDPHTGGPLKVFSLKGGTWECKYEGLMLNELDDPVYANKFFNGRSMFVIINLGHEYILSRESLSEYLWKRFGEDATIHWFCVVSDAFLIYRVILRLPSYCVEWFDTSLVLKEPVRYQNYSNLRGTCPYILCHARKPILERARKMKNFKDLADL